MADFFEGFRWKEVVAILGALTFFVGIWIARTNAIDDRLRVLELEMVAVQCAINTEVCRIIAAPSKAK